MPTSKPRVIFTNSDFSVFILTESKKRCMTERRSQQLQIGQVSAQCEEAQNSLKQGLEDAAKAENLCKASLASARY